MDSCYPGCNPEGLLLPKMFIDCIWKLMPVTVVNADLVVSYQSAPKFAADKLL